MKTRVFIVLLLLAAVPVLGQTVPTLSGRVVDAADMVSGRTEQIISTLLKVHEDSTSNQVVVVTIPNLEGYDIESYSLKIAETWQLGRAERDNGVLFLIARDDRQMRIEVGYGLEEFLPDITAGQIIRNEVTPAFKQGDFDKGTLLGVQAILAALDGTYEGYDSDSDSVSSNDNPAPGLIGIILFWILIYVIAGYLNKRGGGGSSGRGRRRGSGWYGGGWSSGSSSSGGFSGGSSFGGFGGSFGGGGASGGW